MSARWSPDLSLRTERKEEVKVGKSRGAVQLLLSFLHPWLGEGGF